MKNFLIFLCIVASVSATKYCAKTCKNPITKKYIRHIGCNNNRKFAASCKPDIRMVTITNFLKGVLIDAHNDKRNIVAFGTDAKNSSACSMATMEWDQELADLAALNIKQCTWNHDECHNTDKFEYSGQNLAEKWFSPPREYNTTELLLFAVNGWYKEIENIKPSYIDAFPGMTLKIIGHYTVMMSDRNNRLGCAAATFTDFKFNRKYYEVSCNYARNNMLGFPTYFKCRKPASSCKTGNNLRYPNLCSPSEKYEVNKWSKCETCKPAW